MNEFLAKNLGRPLALLGILAIAVAGYFLLTEHARPLMFDPPNWALGEITKGETYHVAVTVSNHGSTDAHILGGTSVCTSVSCAILDGKFPIRIPPGESRKLAMSFRGESGDSFRHDFSLCTDQPGQAIVPFVVVAKLKAVGPSKVAAIAN